MKTGAGRDIRIWPEVYYKAGGAEGGLDLEERRENRVSLPASLAGTAVGSQVLPAGVGVCDKIMSRSGKFGVGDLHDPLEMGTWRK